jgi:hypothetical protein
MNGTSYLVPHSLWELRCREAKWLTQGQWLLWSQGIDAHSLAQSLVLFLHFMLYSLGLIDDMTCLNKRIKILSTCLSHPVAERKKYFLFGAWHMVTIFFFFCSSGFELRALWLLGKCSTTWAAPQSFFILVYFSGRVSCFCRGPTLDCNLLSMASCVTGITGACCHI